MTARVSGWLQKLRGSTEVEDIGAKEKAAAVEEVDSDSDTVSTIDSEEVRQKELLSRQEGANRGKNINPDGDIFIDELWFCSIVAVTCSLNLLLLGLETDYACRGHGCVPKDYELWNAFHYTFTFLFVVELIIRIRTAGPRRYFQGVRGKDKMILICNREVRLKLHFPNCVDCLIIFLGTIDILFIAPASDGKPSLYLASVFRILHLAPCAKHLQLNKAFRELWLVLSALGETMRTLGWVGLMLTLVTWVAAILVTIALLETNSDIIPLDRATWTFDDYWGSVLKTGNSLLQFMTRDKWGDSLVFPLVDRNKSFITIFLIFYVIAGMALMNAIVAVVIEATMATGKANQEEQKKQVEQFERDLLASLQRIFHDADIDGNGEMSKDELHAILRKPNVRDRLRILLIPRVDLEMLFELLDTAEMDQVGQKGQVNCDKFFRGVSKLRGPARASDLHQMSIDLGRADSAVNDMAEVVATANDVLASVLDNMSMADIDIVQDHRDRKDPVLTARRARGSKKISEDVRYPNREALPMAKRHNPWDHFSETGGRVRRPSNGSNAARRQSNLSNTEPELNAARRQSNLSNTGPELNAARRQSNLSNPGPELNAARRQSNLSITGPEHATLDAPPLRSSLLVDAAGGTANKRKSKKPPAPDPNQPPPPPLPEHLRYLKDSEERVKKLTAKQRVRPRRPRRAPQSEDDDD